ncbi:oligoribonuclease [Buchnera aphidicola (Kurisakia onigurumii)]|uniref:oligoribonuclease n=1 Tax=Buchnera aphidicola TaxID=9 RepID=UPI0031B700A6
MKKNKKINKNLIWIDLEMTGLKPEKNFIIEIATVITNIDLKIIAQGPVIPIFQKKYVIESMDSWNFFTHTKNGLIKKIKESKYNEKIAEKKTINFLKKWTIKNESPMCGNTISQDRRFLLKYMPKLESHFHYRNIDVSTLKELILRWYPEKKEIIKKIKKNISHSAIDDIYLSIKELMFYKKNFFKNMK